MAWRITSGVQAGLGLSGSVLCSFPELGLIPWRGTCRAHQPGLDTRGSPNARPCSARTLLQPVLWVTSWESDPFPLRRGHFTFPYTTYHCTEVCWFSLSPRRMFFFWFALKTLFISVAPVPVASDCSVNTFRYMSALAFAYTRCPNSGTEEHRDLESQLCQS